jgi:hypothetical protein
MNYKEKSAVTGIFADIFKVIKKINEEKKK